MDDILALNQLFTDFQRIRNLPCAFGVARGSVVVFLVCLFAAFSFYSTRNYEG